MFGPFGLSGGRAHPRVGGENAVDHESGGVAPGSSPRGRGKPSAGRRDRRRRRLIPAWAGKTPRRRATRCRCPGSSPRGRGKRGRWSVRRRGRGLIPAWAGKTPAPATQRGWLSAHPRVGGENHRPDVAELAINGSSPRGRGKPEVRVRRVERRGLIPAWAGKTTPQSTGWRGPRAHPRVGGEN